MRDLVIVGASGFGREVLQWIKDINKISLEWNIKGFIDDNLDALVGYECDYTILGTISDWIPADNEYFCCAIAAPLVKERIIQLLESKGAHFATIIHPTAIVSDFTCIGRGVVITPKSKISPNVRIGDYVSVLGSSIGHDVMVEDFSTLSGNCSINGHVQIGKYVFVANNVCVLPSRRIADNAYLCMGSVVFTNIKKGVRVIGNPAKKIDF